MPDDALRIVGSGEREDRRLVLTPNAVIPRLTNSILLDAAGGFVGVLTGLSDLATFLCCFPFVGPVDRGDEGHCRLALNWGLIHSWCKLPSCDGKHPSSKQVDTGAAIHRSLEALQFVDLLEAVASPDHLWH